MSDVKITPAMIKELRDRTGAGFLECQQALKAVSGDIEKAMDDMRKAGQAKAAKKTARVASEGVIVIRVSQDAKKAIMLEVNCETDFVSRDENFKKFVDLASQIALQSSADSVEKLMSSCITDGDITLEKERENLIAKIGENIQVRRLVFMSSSNAISHYLHGTRIGVLVELSSPDNEIGKDVAMHIAASRPEFISGAGISSCVIAREKEIYLAQAIASGKPQDIAEKMVAGRIDKFIGETTLLGQPFIKDPSITVADLLNKKSIEVLAFKRFEVGDGIEKQVVDFAAEVEAQISR